MPDNVNEVIRELKTVRLPYLPDSKAYIAITNAIELIEKQLELILANYREWDDRI